MATVLQMQLTLKFPGIVASEQNGGPWHDRHLPRDRYHVLITWHKIQISPLPSDKYHVLITWHNIQISPM